ncbi:hypothetical protein GALMADRAFT_454810 [Galerina marginata CBS 339.88]|uniref:Uncharacterized protein n=1 Tax=Galerina marginata (strain CBS 339.88) TaxID=685588 RepID=A0A067T0Y7_GALM3|nr:hypothetical protein GALMADRAFT_454810 [Galerina marginata CBS 339.88]
MKCLFFFLHTLAICSFVASLGIILQPQTIVGSPTLVLWTRDDTDQDTIIFDLRFVQGNADVGLALANLVLGQGDRFGTGLVTFSADGQFVLKAVTGPQNTVIGTSNKVAAVSLTSSSSSTSVSTSTSATTLASTPTSSSISTDNTASPSSASITAPPIPSQPSASNTSRYEYF